MNAQNIKVNLLKPQENQLVTEEIMKATRSGHLEFTFSDKFDKMIRKEASHYNGILLACSDLVKAYHRQIDIPTIDPMVLLAEEAAKIAMEDLNF